MLNFRKERRHGTGNWKDLFLPPLDKNSEDLAIFILKFNDANVKNHLLFPFFCRGGPVGGPVWGSRFVPSLFKMY